MVHETKTSAPRSPRPGPRPVALHLAAATTTWLSSLAALPLARSGSLPWSGELAEEAARVEPELAAANPEALLKALDVELRRRFARLLDGIEAYQTHPDRRALQDPPVMWQEGTTRLLDYGSEQSAAATPILFVPSLINRAHILDLSERSSLMRYLAQAGLRPLLVEWAAPGADEQAFTLDDYILGRLSAALDVAVAKAGRPAILVGYCMGGLLTLPLALQRPHDVGGLVLLATPWDFHAAGGTHARMISLLGGSLRGVMAASGMLPVDAIQALFAALDPLLAARKFARFADLPPKSAAARDFVALEDWLNDGVPLVAKVAEECLFGWYGENTPGRGRWHVGGQAVHPQRLSCPALNVVPARDRIVPPESAEPLGLLIPNAETWRPALGHIGMIASPRAERTLWRPLTDWMRRHGEAA